MAGKAQKQKLFVESIPLVADNVSGVGQALAGLVSALAANEKFTKVYDIILIGPSKRLHLIDRWPALKNVQRKGVPLKLRIMNRLSRYHLLPKMDRLLGKGVYLFGSFNNWPLTKNSTSFTYVHDIGYAIYPDSVQTSNLKMLQKNMPYFVKRTDYVVTVSDSSRKEIIAEFKLDPKKVLMLHNGLKPENLQSHTRQSVASVRKKYGIPEKYLLFVGNIEPRKNLERLIDAFATLPKKQALVLVGGDGWKNEAVFTAIDKANHSGATVIKPKTYVPDAEVASLMAGATGFVFPSIHEGFGMPPLEAMAAGAPVVVADIPALREVVGDAGIYCDPFDTSSIAKALQKVLNLSESDKFKLIKKGKMQSAKFSWEQSGQKFADFLLKLRG